MFLPSSLSTERKYIMGVMSSGSKVRETQIQILIHVLLVIEHTWVAQSVLASASLAVSRVVHKVSVNVNDILHGKHSTHIVST